MPNARGLAAAIGALVIVATGGVTHAQSNRCNASKLKFAAAKAGGLALCRAKAVAKGVAVDPICVVKAENKVSAGFVRAESRPPCLTTGDAGAIEADVDGLLGALASELPDAGPSRCEGTKWRAAGKKAKGRLLCHSKAVLRAVPVDPACLLKQEAKFAASFVKAESAGPCPGSASVVEGVVDAGVDDVASALGSGSNVCPDCCANTRFSFTTAPGSGVCGAADPGVCMGPTDPGIPCTTDFECSFPDVCLGDLACGGLYVGGGAVQATLPSTVGDGTQSITKIVNCSPQTTVFYLVATTAAETGSIRTCTSGGVPNPDYPACVGGDSGGLPCRTNADCAFPGTCTGTQSGCLFGAPQPITNGSDPSTSLCVVDRIDSDAAGRATCAGYGFTNLVLGADVYLTGDVDGNAANGTQPCPICEAGSCVGGPRNGLACTAPGTDLGAAYPTSHDCPPPAAAFVGTLRVPVTLATGGGSLTATDTDGPGGQPEIFCGFCRRFDAPNDFELPPRPCAANAECTASPFTLCQQRSPGAFHLGMARYVNASGRPSDACLTDGAPHATTLGAAFCVPPSGNPLVDGALDLPGPGAVSLPGTAQLLP
jgi:hypothetical protein